MIPVTRFDVKEFSSLDDYNGSGADYFFSCLVGKPSFLTALLFYLILS